MPTIDTLKLKTRLSENGMPEPQALALVEELDEALSTAIAQEVATKADIAELQGTVQSLNERLSGLMGLLEQRLNARIDNLEARFDGETKLLRWMATATLTIVVAIGIRSLFL